MQTSRASSCTGPGLWVHAGEVPVATVNYTRIYSIVFLHFWKASYYLALSYLTVSKTE